VNYYEDPYESNERQLFPSFFNPTLPGGGSFPGMGPGGQSNFPGPGSFPGGGQPGFPGPGPFPGGGHGGGTGGGNQEAAPTSPPPSFIPQQNPFQTKAIDPGAIRGCLFRFTYIWLRRDSFWFYPTFIGRNSISGFRWNGFRWVLFGTNLNRIESFQCF